MIGERGISVINSIEMRLENIRKNICLESMEEILEKYGFLRVFNFCAIWKGCMCVGKYIHVWKGCERYVKIFVCLDWWGKFWVEGQFQIMSRFDWKTLKLQFWVTTSINSLNCMMSLDSDEIFDWLWGEWGNNFKVM